MKKVRVAVVGVGYLGNFHAQKYAALPGVELVGVVDSDQARAAEIAAALKTRAFADYRDLIGQVDAVSVVVPTSMHFEVGAFFLQHGVHMLMEKPITTTVAEARELIALAAAKGLVLQVGHLERFNPALTAVQGEISRPLFIDAVRVAPYKPRATDVSVVLDLMVHDLDIISTLVGSPVKAIAAAGASILSPTPDIANARIEYENGTVATVTASRISPTSERQVKIYQDDSWIMVDFQNRQATVSRRGEGESSPGIPAFSTDERVVEQRDQIRAEIEAFIASIVDGSPVVVSGEDGMRALETALLIEEKVRENSALLHAGA